MNNRPNILVLILDTLRARDMSLYGYQVPTSPCIDHFGSQSIVYEKAVSPAVWTIPAHASLLTGLYPTQHRIENMEGDRRLNRRLVTLPEALQRAGYETVAFSQNPLFAPAHGMADGFSRFIEASDLARARVSSKAAKRLVGSRVHSVRQAGLYLERLLAPEDALRGVANWMNKRDSGRPFFAFVNVLAPHFPWVVPPHMLLRARALNPKYLTRRDFVALKRMSEFNAQLMTPSPAHLRMWRRLYDAAVMHVDACFGRFVENAAVWSGWGDTIVVVTSDHGEMLGDYRGIVGHTLSLHDDLIRVPLIVRHPDRQGGLRVPEVVQTLDLYRTILDWSGTPLHTLPAAQTALPSLDDPPLDRVAIAEEDYTDSWDVPARLKALNPSLDDRAYPRSQRAARSATHKYIDYDTGPGEFYDLRTDPGERHNIISTEDANQVRHLRKLQTALLEWEAEREVFPPVELVTGAAQSDEVEDRLRALGYFS